MTCAYDEVYLECARRVLARMLDFAVYELKYGLEEFFELFLTSGLAERFGEGDFQLTAGMSGVELAFLVLEESKIPQVRFHPSYPVDRSAEYWTGWALAYYQWRSARTYEEIVRRVPIEDIRDLYMPYHEMDIRQFADRMEELMGEK